MNKEEILEKSRKENKEMDERDRFIKNKSDVWSLGIVFWIVVFLVIVKLCFKQNVYDLLCIGWGICLGDRIYKGVINKNKRDIGFAILYGALMILNFIKFIMSLI